MKAQHKRNKNEKRMTIREVVLFVVPVISIIATTLMGGVLIKELQKDNSPLTELAAATVVLSIFLSLILVAEAQSEALKD